jgi:uncharacterized protein YukJ
LFQTATSVPAKLKTGLRALNHGYMKNASKSGWLAQDYVRGGIVKPISMKPVPPDTPGVDNDLKDKLEDAILKALSEPGSLIEIWPDNFGR